MKIGYFISSQKPSGTDSVTALNEQIKLVQYARDQGWDSFFTGQHYLCEEDIQMFQNIPVLSRLKAEAGHMTLGIGVLLINLLNPVFIAETVATMDVIAEGNMAFGVGLGYRDVEFDALGVPKGQRLKRFLDCLDLVKRLWTEDEVSFESDYCVLNKVKLNMRPIQKPYPPIWFAANSDPAVKRAAHLGDTLFINPHATTQTINRQMDIYRSELDSLGKPFPKELPCIKEVFCAKDKKTALEMARPFLEVKYADYARTGQDKALPEDEVSWDNLPFEELMKDRFILGSPEECYEGLLPYLQMGVNHLIIRTSWIGMPYSTTLQSMRLFSEEVVPALKKESEQQT
tara:strand:+ start:11785 stop:12816 length:1032 start_codon:yes stop_codon:yes gene_type:complete